MRRSFVLSSLLLLLTLADARAAFAQTATPASGSVPASGVRMALLGQSAWNAADRPLSITVSATNGGAVTYGDLIVVLTIRSPARSRSVYEESLTQDATPPVFTLAFPQKGTLHPGASRRFTIVQDLNIPTIGNESALYPLQVDLRSGDQVLATIRTPMVFLASPPAVPLDLTWTFVLSDPVQFGPDGVLRPGPVEADIAPGGRLQTTVATLAGPHGVNANVVLSPVLLDELRRMAGGYRRRDGSGAISGVAAGTGGAADAASLLRDLRSLVARPGVETVALPFGDVSVPATLSAGFRNLGTLLRLGREEVQQALGVVPAANVLRPPWSQLLAPDLGQVLARGVTTLLVDPDFVPAEQRPAFTPSPLARLGTQSRAVTTVVPDPGVAALAAAYPDDPVLAAHAALGEMAAAYFEFPNRAGRGIAMLSPERPATPPGLLAPLAGLVHASPWLAPRTAGSFLSRVDEDAPLTPVPNRTYRTFPTSYVAALRAARADVSVFRRTATNAGAAADAMSHDLLVAQSGTFVSDPAGGLAYVTAVRSAIASTYRKVVPVGSTITLASGKGPLPLTIRNDSRYTLHAQVVLTADPRLVIEGGGRKAVTLPAGASVALQFAVDAQSTGRFLTVVQLLTPTGQPMTGRTQIVVRSTAYNLVALAITLGAALFLALWWGRRFLPRRAS